MRLIPIPWRGLLDEQDSVEDLPVLAWNAELRLPNLEISVFHRENGTGPLERMDLTWDFFSPAGDASPPDALKKNLLLRPRYKVTPQTFLNGFLKRGPFYASDKSFLEGLAGRPATVGIVLRWPDAEGGATNQLILYAKELLKRGVTVTFYGVTAKIPEWAKREGLRFICVEKLLSLFEAVQDDVIVISSILDAVGLQFHPNLTNKRVVHICQGIETYHYGRNPAELYAEKTLFDLLHSLPLARISNSNHISNYFRHRFGQDCWDIPNALSEKFFSPSLPAVKPFTNPDAIRVLWIGHPRTYLKGFRIFKAAIARVKKEFPGKKIMSRLIVPVKGDPNELDLADMQDVELTMQATQAEMPEIYSECDVLLSTSYYEGFGMPVLEAMAMGLPVVTTDSMGLSGIIEDRTHALVVSPGDITGLAESVCTLARDQSLRETLVKNGKIVAGSFREEKRTERLIETFSQILCRPLAKDSGSVSESAFRSPSNSLSEQVICESVTAAPLTRPKFSVLMPTYNQASYIPESIESVLSQTYRDFELVICDDGSTDNTPEVIRQYAARDPRIRHVRKPNGGTGSALNRALQESRGEWVTWLSSDDLYEPRALEIFQSAIGNNPACRFFHAHFSVLREGKDAREFPVVHGANVMTPPHLQVLRLLEDNHVNGITICIAREALFEVGLFNEGNRNGQDYEMWLNLSARFPWIFIPERVACSRLQPLTVQVSFPEAGVYDSAAGGLNFLNKFAFPKYFPLLDLSNPEHAWIALLSSIQLAVKTDSFLYQGMGHVPAFIERMLEWISAPQQDGIRTALLPTLQALKEPLKSSPLPENLHKALLRVIDCGAERFVYKPYDPFELMHRNMYSHEAAGRTNEAELIRKFLKKVKRLETQPGTSSGTEPRAGI